MDENVSISLEIVGGRNMDKKAKEAAVKDEALKESFAEIRKAADEVGIKPVEKTEEKNASDKKPAVKKTAAKKTSDKKISDKKASDKKASDKDASDKKVSDKNVSDKKPAVKKAAAKPAEQKPEEKPVEQKAAEEKPAEVKPSVKKPAEKKPAAKTTAVKTAAVKTDLVLQIDGLDFDLAKVQAKAEKAALKISGNAKKIKVYINVAEKAAYYTIDGKGNADYRIDL